MAEKVTTMKLKVDLQCDKYCKKVKKVLCKFPQIRDQEYDYKNNVVTITVVCCNPEKIRDKLCCKGCGVIISIEIVEPPEQPPPPPPPPPTPPPPVVVPIVVCCGPCSEGHAGGPCSHGYGRQCQCHCGCYGRPICGSYGWVRRSYGIRCEEYFCEESTSGCTIV